MEPSLILAVIGGAVGVAAVLVKLTSWVFAAALRRALEPLFLRLAAVEQQQVLEKVRQSLLWGMAEQRAMETVHHSAQPAFDALIDDFRSHKLTRQQLTQFIERLQAIIADPKMVEETPPARLLLNSALAQQELRTAFTDQVPSQTVLQENLNAGEEMAREAAIQREIEEAHGKE